MAVEILVYTCLIGLLPLHGFSQLSAPPKRSPRPSHRSACSPRTANVEGFRSRHLRSMSVPCHSFVPLGSVSSKDRNRRFSRCLRRSELFESLWALILVLLLQIWGNLGTLKKSTNYDGSGEQEQLLAGDADYWEKHQKPVVAWQCALTSKFPSSNDWVVVLDVGPVKTSEGARYSFYKGIKRNLKETVKTKRLWKGSTWKSGEISLW